MRKRRIQEEAEEENTKNLLIGRQQKSFLIRLYHHAKIQKDCSATKIFMSISIIF
jgi:hypothetical protein